MKIVQTESGDGYEGRLEISISTDTGSDSVSFGNGEPEDMCLARDLSDAYSIVDMLVLAYEAGKRGETMEIVNEEE